MKHQDIINTSLFSLITIMFGISTITNSIVFVIYYLVFLATIMFFKITNKKTEEFNDTITIFLSSLFFGFILALMVNLDFFENGVTFLYPDQLYFYEEAKNLSLSNSFKDVVNRVFIDYNGYQVIHLINGVLAYLDKIISGTVHFLPLIYSVVFITALIPVFLYHILKLYLPRLITLKSTLYYSLLTPIIAYSGYLLRDMHITLITMFALFLIVRKISISKILILLILIPITYQLREPNSLLIVAMLGIFIFTNNTPITFKFAYIILGVLLLFVFRNDIYDLVLATEDRLERYTLFTTKIVEEGAGISGFFLRLPPVIKESTIILFVLSAFPFFNTFLSANNLPQFVMSTYNSITNIGWYFIFIGILFFIKPIYIKLRKMPGKVFYFLFFLFIAYMFVNTANMTFRRVICVFPFVYIPFVLVFNDLNKYKRATYKRAALYTAGSLYFFYFLFLI